MDSVATCLSRRRLSKTYEAVKENDWETLLNLNPNPNQKYTYTVCGVELPISLLDQALRSQSYTCAKWLLDNGAQPYPTDSFAGHFYALERRRVSHLITQHSNFHPEDGDQTHALPKFFTDTPQLALAVAFYRAQKLNPPSESILDVHRWTNVSPTVAKWFESQIPAYEASLLKMSSKQTILKM